MLLEEINTLVLPSKVECIEELEVLISGIYTKYSICQDSYGNVLVALTEAVNNAIMHGNAQCGEKQVYITYLWQSPVLVFTVSDRGKGFDHTCLPDPTDPENIEKPKGRGVFLMRKLSDNIEFDSNGSLVKLCFKVV